MKTLIFTLSTLALFINTKMDNNLSESLNLETTITGVVTNNKLETNIPNVYAIGDMNGKMMLAHVASAEGIVAVENILGKQSIKTRIC